MCIGKEGNFTLVVEEPSPDAQANTEGSASAEEGSEAAEEDSAASEEAASSGAQNVEVIEGKRTEFKVWASLLSSWSPVFERMLSSDNYVESKESQVVISDFAAEAVEIFVHFLYTGVVKGTPGVLVQVAALADQVNKLHTLCLKSVMTALTPETACEIFAAADHFHVTDLREEALEKILISPDKALQARPNLSAKLLEEILDSGLLCLDDTALAKMLRAWGENKEGGDLLQPVIEAHIKRATARKSGEHSKHVLSTLWSRYEKAGKKGAFLGYWVVVTLGQAELGTEDAKSLVDRARLGRVNGLGPGWMKWELPHSAVRVMGFSFSYIDIPNTVSLEILCSEDGVAWHLATTCKKQGIKAFTLLACKKPPGLVKFFKVKVLEGEIASTTDLNIHGILQSD